jgi:hypothetical protein
MGEIGATTPANIFIPPIDDQTNYAITCYDIDKPAPISALAIRTFTHVPFFA